jgi:RHS repeat-associated protein
LGYDPFGRRIEKISPTSGTTIYAYDGDNVVEQLNASGSPTARFTQGPGIDEPLEVQIGRGNYYYSADGLGSVVALTKSNGPAVNTYFGYNTFGWVNATDTVANPFRFTGREWDSETNLYYYRARYYDPLWGRFLSEDPARFGGGADFYAYVGNSPADLVDPYGLSACTELRKCPPHWLQALIFSEIITNPGTAPQYWAARGVAAATGNAAVVGVSGSAGGSVWPEGMLGGALGVSTGLAVDRCGNVGLLVSGQVGGGYNGGPGGRGIAYAGGPSISFTHSPTIFGLGGSSPVVGVSGGAGYGGSVTRTLSGTTTITVGAAGGVGTLGGVKGAKVIPLVCPNNCK